MKEKKQRLKGDASNPRISLAASQTDTESAARLYGGDKLAELGNTVSMTDQSSLQVDKQHTVTVTPIAGQEEEEQNTELIVAPDEPAVGGNDENEAGATTETAD